MEVSRIEPKIIRAQIRLAILLAATAGYVDAYGLLTYAAYVSLMGGNTTQTGSDAAVGKYVSAGHAALAIVCFVSGIILGTLLTYSKSQRSRRAAFGLAALLLGVNVTATILGVIDSWTGIITLSLAMGMVNTTLSHVGPEKVSLTFVTGMLNHIGTHIALAIKRDPPDGAQGPHDTHWKRAGLLAAIWISFVIGAAASAALAHYASESQRVYVIVPALVALTLLAAFGRVPE